MTEDVPVQQDFKHADTLTYTAQIPVSAYQKALRDEFIENADVDEESWKKTIHMRHKSEVGLSSAYAVKRNPLSNWVVNIRTPQSEKYQETYNLFRGIKGITKASATHLATSVLDAKVHLEQVQKHELTDLEVIEATVGESGRTIPFNDRVGNDDELLTYEATIPMPPEFAVSYQRFFDGAEIDEEAGIIMVGDHVSGRVRVDQLDNGDWEAVGLADYDYDRRFDESYGLADVRHEVSEDMASKELSADVIENHIRRHGLSKNEIHYIETYRNGVIYEGLGYQAPGKNRERIVTMPEHLIPD